MPCCWIVIFKTEFHELELQYYYFTHTNMILQFLFLFSTLLTTNYLNFITGLNRIGLKELLRENMQTNSDLDYSKSQENTAISCKNKKSGTE